MNLIFPSWFFKNQVQMDRATGRLEGKGVKYWNCDCLIGVFPRIFPQKFIIISGRRLPCSTVILSKALENHDFSYLEETFRIFKIFDMFYENSKRFYEDDWYKKTLEYTATLNRVEHGTSREILRWRQGYPVSITVFPCNRKNDCRLTLLLSQDFPACSLF